jgi:hypothetical protein
VNGITYERGPWYSLSTREKAWRWLRYQPGFKVRQFAAWVGCTVEWYARWRRLPKRDPASTWCNRIAEDGDAVCPWCVWKFTVARDAPQMERFYRVVFPAELAS